MGDISKQLILHCTPTLAGMKTAGLFGYSFASELELTNSLRSANQTLNPKGIFAEVLRIRNNNALIFVYRKSMLCADLGNMDVKMFLAAHGYHGDSVGGYIERLKFRLSQGPEFPHEIGLFLGYPLHDVLGFIVHNGQNSKCSGYWKVYEKEAEALKIFAKFNKCREIYAKLFSQGRPIERLIVAA